MAFDITKALGAAAARKEEPELRMIPLHMIDRNPSNFYSMDGINALADNIRMVGLLEPILVKETPDGRYTVISGHRRREALRMNAYTDKRYPESMHDPVPCLIARDAGTLAGAEGENAARVREIADELKVVFANSDTRELTSSDKSMQVRKLRELLTELRDLGCEELAVGKMRDHIAAAAKISPTRVARLDVIEKGLRAPMLRDAWQRGTLGETSAYEAARYDPEVQEALSAAEIEQLCDMTVEKVRAAMEQKKAAVEAEKRIAVRKAKPEAEFPVRVEAKPEPEAPKFDGHGHLEYDGRAYLAERERENREYAEMLQAAAAGLLRPLRPINDRQDGIEQLKNHHGKSYHGWSTDGGFVIASPKGLTLENWRPGQPGKKITRTWTEAYDMLCAYIMNRAPEILNPKVSAADTGAGWQTGEPETVSAADTGLDPEWIREPEPPQDGRYLCLVDMNTNTLHEQRCDWKNGQWYAYGQPLHDLFTVKAWWRLPCRQPCQRPVTLTQTALCPSF